MDSYFVGLDLGQQADYTALTVIQTVDVPHGEPVETEVKGTLQMLKVDGFLKGAVGKLHEGSQIDIRRKTTRQPTIRHYHLRHLERFKLGTPYPEIARQVKKLLGRAPLEGQAETIVDATGVGRPVVDMLREEEIPNLHAVTITGGDTVTHAGGEYRVPKRDLASTLQVLLQNGRLRFAQGLPLAEVLVAEMQNFKVKINIATGHDSYEAWREGEHDDLVLSLALACWYAETLGQIDYTRVF